MRATSDANAKLDSIPFGRRNKPDANFTCKRFLAINARSCDLVVRANPNGFCFVTHGQAHKISAVPTLCSTSRQSIFGRSNARI